MAVAKKQLDEVLTVLRGYVPEDRIGPMLASLHSTEAGRKNQSFRQTIWALITKWAETNHPKGISGCCGSELYEAMEGAQIYYICKGCGAKQAKRMS